VAAVASHLVARSRRRLQGERRQPRLLSLSSPLTSTAGWPDSICTVHILHIHRAVLLERRPPFANSPHTAGSISRVRASSQLLSSLTRRSPCCTTVLHSAEPAAPAAPSASSRSTKRAARPLLLLLDLFLVERQSACAAAQLDTQPLTTDGHASARGAQQRPLGVQAGRGRRRGRAPDSGRASPRSQGRPPLDAHPALLGRAAVLRQCVHRLSLSRASPADAPLPPPPPPPPPRPSLRLFPIAQKQSSARPPSLASSRTSACRPRTSTPRRARPSSRPCGTRPPRPLSVRPPPDPLDDELNVR